MRTPGGDFIPNIWYPVGSVTLETTNDAPAPTASENTSLVLRTGTAWFTGSAQYDVFAWQTAMLERGHLLSGLAAFIDGEFDNFAQDSAWVRIRDSRGLIIATPWHELSGQAGSRQIFPWVTWEWLIPESGRYTIEIGTSTQSDALFGSGAKFDAIRVVEPSSLLLLLVGFALLIRRRRRLTVAAVAALLASVERPAAAGPILNGSFEDGFLGWAVEVPLNPALNGTMAPSGEAYLVTTGTLPPRTNAAAIHDAIDGDRFAYLRTGQNTFEDEGRGGAEIVLSQTLTLDAGSMLSGLAFFYNGDALEQDGAFVRVLDSGGTVVAIPWAHTSGVESLGSTTPYGSLTPWTLWTWTPIYTGPYTLVLGVSTYGDNEMSSRAGFDRIAVPEPNAAILLLLAIAACAMVVSRYSNVPAGNSCSSLEPLGQGSLQVLS